MDENTKKFIIDDINEMNKYYKPRDPKRIDRILEKLGKLWKEYPDQRLGQLIENYVIPAGKMRGPNTCWIFYAEDDVTEKNLDKELNKKVN